MVAATHTFLFYRTPTSKISDIPLPENLDPTQKLEFTPSPDLVNSLDESYQNNIVRKIPPKSRGRRLIQTDEGYASWLPVISGNFEIAAGEARTKLHDFRKLPQSDSFHVFGVFGLQYPDGPSYFNIDPTDELGFMIEATRGRHVGITKEIMDFSVTLSYGGDI